MHELTRTCLVLSLILYSTSCATVMTGYHDTLDVSSTPSGASFQTNTGVSGSTPAAIEVPDEVDVLFTFDLEGYQSTTYTAVSRTSKWVWGNIIIGGLIGLIVDYASGGVHTHDSEVHVTLVPTS